MNVRICSPAVLIHSPQHARSDCSPNIQDNGSNLEGPNETVDLGCIAIPATELRSMVAILEDELPLWVKETVNSLLRLQDLADLVTVSSGIACAALPG